MSLSRVRPSPSPAASPRKRNKCEGSGFLREQSHFWTVRHYFHPHFRHEYLWQQFVATPEEPLWPRFTGLESLASVNGFKGVVKDVVEQKWPLCVKVFVLLWIFWTG